MVHRNLIYSARQSLKIYQVREHVLRIVTKQKTAVKADIIVQTTGIEWEFV